MRTIIKNLLTVLCLILCVVFLYFGFTGTFHPDWKTNFLIGMLFIIIAAIFFSCLLIRIMYWDLHKTIEDPD